MEDVLLAIILIASILSLSSIVIAASEASSGDMNIARTTCPSNQPPGVWDFQFAGSMMREIADMHGWQEIGGAVMGFNAAGRWVQIGRFETMRWNNANWHHFHITHAD